MLVALLRVAGIITCTAFLALTEASAVLLFEGEGSGRSRLLGNQGLSGEEQKTQLVSWLVPHLDGSREARMLEGIPGPWPRALVAPVQEGGELLGHALLLYPGSPPEGIGT